jgi:hypothetical protein
MKPEATSVHATNKELIINLFGLILAYFSPVMGIFLMLIFAALADHFMGVWRAVKKKEKVSFLWGLLTSFTKALQYFLIVAVVFMVEKYVLNDLVKQFLEIKAQFLGVKLTGLALALLELKSINKSYKDVKGVGLFSALFEGTGKARKLVNEIGKVKSGLSILILGAFLFSCSNAKQAQRGLDKFYKNGGKIEAQKVPVIIRDTLKIMGKDSIIERTVFIDCPQAETPKTNTEIRQERKSEKDSLKHSEQLYKLRNEFILDSLAEDRKTKKVEGVISNKGKKQDRKKVKAEAKQAEKWTDKPLILFGLAFSLFSLGFLVGKFFKIH